MSEKLYEKWERGDCYYDTPDELLERGIDNILRGGPIKERRRLLFEEPLEDMPMRINSSVTAIRMVAEWRLRIGK